MTENTWFSDERPAEIEQFWNAAYPEIDTISAKIAAMQRAGYEFVCAFTLPGKCWSDFYATQEQAKEVFMAKHADNPVARAFIDGEVHERSLYEKYGKFYGYVFYIGRRV